MRRSYPLLAWLAKQLPRQLPWVNEEKPIPRKNTAMSKTSAIHTIQNMHVIPMCFGCNCGAHKFQNRIQLTSFSKFTPSPTLSLLNWLPKRCQSPYFAGFLPKDEMIIGKLLCKDSSFGCLYTENATAFESYPQFHTIISSLSSQPTSIEDPGCRVLMQQPL